METSLMNFVSLVNNDADCQGDLLEFGTGHGHSTEIIAFNLEQGHIYTFDGFRGLPKTNKGIPRGTSWHEGAFMSNYIATKEYLSRFENITITQCMTWELKEPFEYGIKKIAGVNIDVDLYEGTLDGLIFADKCEWSSLIIRFDDWGYWEGLQVKEEVAAHEEAAFFDFINSRGYKYEFYEDLNKLVDNKQVIVKIQR